MVSLTHRRIRDAFLMHRGVDIDRICHCGLRTAMASYRCAQTSRLTQTIMPLSFNVAIRVSKTPLCAVNYIAQQQLYLFVQFLWWCFLISNLRMTFPADCARYPPGDPLDDPNKPMTWSSSGPSQQPHKYVVSPFELTSILVIQNAFSPWSETNQSFMRYLLFFSAEFDLHLIFILWWFWRQPKTDIVLWLTITT